MSLFDVAVGVIGSNRFRLVLQRRRLGAGVIAAMLFLAGSAAPSLAGRILFVKADADGANDGLSWQTAYVDLQAALEHAEAAAGAVSEIWIAGGTYFPAARIVADDPRTATFQIPRGVSLRGGFAGWEARPDERDGSSRRSVLSGDLAGDDGFDFVNTSDNVNHVVTTSLMDNPAILERLTITGGSAEGGQGLDSFSGGGVFNDNGDPTFVDCDFLANQASLPWGGTLSATAVRTFNGGGGLYNNGGNVTLTRCTFSRNITGNVGGGLFTQDGSVLLTRCTFRSNVASSFPRGDGGAIYVLSGDTTLADCTFTLNKSEHSGGALFSGGTTSIARCVFSYNTAGRDGGALQHLAYGALSLSHCQFAWNRADGDGGAVYAAAQEGNITIGFCAFDRNHATTQAGALYAEASPSEQTTVTDCSFTRNSSLSGGAVLSIGEVIFSRCAFRDNRADSRGGGLEFIGLLRLSACDFVDNNALLGGAITGWGAVIASNCTFVENGAYDGGALWAHDADVLLTSSLLANNHVAGFGGAIALGDGSLSLIHCTLAANRSLGRAGGIITGVAPTLVDCILWGNRSGAADEFDVELDQIDGAQPANIRYTTIQGWTGALGGIGNDGNDPILDDGYRLTRDSPSIDTGDPDFVPEPSATDLDGHARVLCDRVDRGAYEFGAGDFDCDGTITLNDFAEWAGCMDGPIEGASLLTCVPFDFDSDGDTDLRDFSAFQRAVDEP